MAYRSYEKRESVYLNKEEAQLIKNALYSIMSDAKDDADKDMICELVAEMNSCIQENEERDRKQMASENAEELLNEE